MRRLQNSLKDFWTVVLYLVGLVVAALLVVRYGGIGVGCAGVMWVGILTYAWWQHP